MDLNNKLMPKWFPITLILTAFIGFLDSLYLSINAFTTGYTECSLIDGCEVVTSSAYAMFLGLPTSFYGVIFYIAIFFMAIWYWDQKSKVVMDAIFYLSIIGFLVSAFLVFVQAYILEAFCLYCLVSAVTSTIIFILGLTFFFIIRPALSE